MQLAAGKAVDASPHAVAAPNAEKLSDLKPPPCRGKFVSEATGRSKVGKWTPITPTITGKLRTVTPFDTHLKMKPRSEWNKEMAKLGPDTPPIGHFHDLPFPYTFEMIVAMGAPWLTKAMHAAGTLPRSNRVVTLEAEAFVGGSMSLKAFLTVSYETPDEALQTHLFVKYPFPATTPHEQKGTYIGKFVMNNDGPEMDFMRILSAAAPCRSPTYIFGDICLKTGMALLITERLAVPSHTSDFGPFEYEPIPYKSVDYLLDQPMAYYEAMTRNIAQLAAWGKIGKLGGGIEDVFPPPSYPAALNMGTKKRAETYFAFLSEHATCLVPPAMRTPDVGAAMVATLCEVEASQTAILTYLFAHERYCGFTHQNMNTDNATFWRDQHGKVQSGFIDWGRFKKDNFARALSNGYMCTDMCEMLQEHDEHLVRAYVDAFNAAGGEQVERLNFDVMWKHYLLSWLLLGLSVVDMPRQICYLCGPSTALEQWATITDYKDARIFNMPQYMNGCVAIVRNFAHYFTTKNLAAFWKEWKDENLVLKPGKTMYELKPRAVEAAVLKEWLVRFGKGSAADTTVRRVLACPAGDFYAVVGAPRFQEPPRQEYLKLSLLLHPDVVQSWDSQKRNQISALLSARLLR